MLINKDEDLTIFIIRFIIYSMVVLFIPYMVYSEYERIQLEAKQKKFCLDTGNEYIKHGRFSFCIKKDSLIWSSENNDI